MEEIIVSKRSKKFEQILLDPGYPRRRFRKFVLNFKFVPPTLKYYSLHRMKGWFQRGKFAARIYTCVAMFVKTSGVGGRNWGMENDTLKILSLKFTMYL